MIQVHPISADVRVVFDQRRAPVLSEDVETQVEAIWSTELSQRGNPPFNGSLFSVASHASRAIVGWRIEYKAFLAQMRAPSLFSALMIRPLAITGLLVCRDGVVFGKRSSDVEQDKNLWELVPAGGVDCSQLGPDGSIDLSSNLLKELTEETGIESSDIVTAARPFALVEDARSHVFDLGIMLNTSLGRRQIIERFGEVRNHEYSELQVIEIGRVGDFADHSSFSLGPVSAALLEAINFNPPTV